MSTSYTPDFQAQDANSLAQVRFYTALDPYYYTVDNRPLQDLDSNIRAIGTGGSDAGRRASLINALNMSMLMTDQYYIPTNLTGNPRSIAGLKVSVAGANVVQIGQGCVMQMNYISDSQQTPVMKMAMLTAPVSFNIPSPAGAGQEITYTIEGQFVTLGSPAAMAGSAVPYLDPNNPYLPSTLANGELRLSLVSGTAAAQGSSVPPPVTPGHFPIYTLLLYSGGTSPFVNIHPQGPYRKPNIIRAIPTVGSGDPNITMNAIGQVNMAKGTGSMAKFTPTKSLKDLDPYRPIQVQFVFSTSDSNANIGFSLGMFQYQSGLSYLAGSIANLSNYIMTANGQNLTVSPTYPIPNSAFCTYLPDGTWGVNVSEVYFGVSRSTVPQDTSSNPVQLYELIISQV